MSGLTTDVVNKACAIYLQIAYPTLEQIPEDRYAFTQLPAGQSWIDFQAQQSYPPTLFQQIKDRQGQVSGYALRLGCSHYQHLKLKILSKDVRGESTCVFMVDTHDAFFRPPPDHPDAPAWQQLQANNLKMKQSIEAAWEGAGLMTFNELLRQDLND